MKKEDNPHKTIPFNEFHGTPGRIPIDKLRASSPAAYGFEVRTSEFPNLLKLLQATEFIGYDFPHFF
jgi:hypothetical protein